MELQAMNRSRSGDAADTFNVNFDEGHLVSAIRELGISSLDELENTYTTDTTGAIATVFIDHGWHIDVPEGYSITNIDNCF